MTEKQWKWMFNGLLVIVLLVCGFFLGRCTVETKSEVKTEYIQGETKTDTLYYPKPYKVVVPSDVDTLAFLKQCIKDGIYKELWPERDVPKKEDDMEMSKSDSTEIMKDWASKRFYSETLFSNENDGHCSFNAEVQYNRLKLVGYSFTPITKTITETKYITKKFEPFAGLSYLTNPWGEVKNPSVQVNAGVFIKEKYGVQALYQRGFKLKDDYVGVGVVMKF